MGTKGQATPSGIRRCCIRGQKCTLAFGVGLLSLLAACSTGSGTSGMTGTAGGALTPFGTSTSTQVITSLAFPSGTTTSGAAITVGNVDPFVTLTWQPTFPTPDFYEITIGTTPYGTDIYYSEIISNTQTSIQPWGLLPDGHIYYATLFSVTGNTYPNTQIIFQTSTKVTLGDRATLYSTVESLTKQVREMTVGGPYTAPLPGTPLFSIASRRHNTPNPGGPDCVDFSLALISLMLPQRISVRMRTTTLDGTGYEGHTMDEYWDPFLNRWNLADATFGVVYFDDATQTGQSLLEMNQLVLNKNYAAVQEKFVSKWGDLVYRIYYMDPLSLYLNPVDPIGGNYSPVSNDPRSALSLHTQSDVVGVAGTYLLEFASLGDSATVSDPHGYGNLSLAPIPIVLGSKPMYFSRAYGFSSGWSFTKVPSSTKVYTFPVLWTNTPTLLYPFDGDNDVDTSSPIPFHWTEIAGAPAYRLDVGTSQGANDVFTSGEVPVTTLPVQLGKNPTYYIRTSAKGSDGNWHYRDSTISTGY